MSETSSTDQAGESFADIFNNMTNTVKEGELAQGKILAIDDDFIALIEALLGRCKLRDWICLVSLVEQMSRTLGNSLGFGNR